MQPLWPHLGASPDGIVECLCCGKGVCEIKCPFCYKDQQLKTAVDQKNSCLVSVDGEMKLDTSHSYYYQVQAQIFICGVDYCDFVVYTDKDIHIERVFPNDVFWQNAKELATTFLKHAILPELVGKWFTRAVATESSTHEINSTVEKQNNVWCYCKKDLADATLIGCDNDACTISWFHITCMKLGTVPKGKWYCPTCWQTQKK